MKPESRFRINRIDPFLKDLGIFHDAIQQKSKGGTPDYYLGICGKLVALEVKDDANKDGLTPLQLDVRWKIRNRGKALYIAVSQTGKSPGTMAWEDVKVLLTKLAKGEEV